MYFRCKKIRDELPALSYMVSVENIKEGHMKVTHLVRYSNQLPLHGLLDGRRGKREGDVGHAKQRGQYKSTKSEQIQTWVK